MLFVGLHHGPGFLPRLIKLQSRARYWHVSLRIGSSRPDDIVYQATWADDVHWRTAGEFDAHVDWFLIEDTTPEEEHRASVAAISYLAWHYDWWSLLRFLIPIRLLFGDRESRATRKRLYCAEYVLQVLRDARINVLARILPFRCPPALFEWSPRLVLWKGP